MTPLLAASLLLALLSSNGIVQSSTTPLLSPRPVKGHPSPRINPLALALQQEKYQFGAIGCNFSDSVCDLNLEYCFNDHAFGKCVSLLGTSKEDSYKFNLKRDDVHLLELAMEELFEKGFRWGHSYTQCILQNFLLSIRQRVNTAHFDCVEDPVEDEVKDESNPEPETLAFLPTEQEILSSAPMKKSPKIHSQRDAIRTEPIRNYFKEASMLEPSISTDELEEALEDSELEDYLDLAHLTPGKGHLPGNAEWLETPVRDSPSFDQFPNFKPFEDGLEADLVEPKIFGSKYNTPEGFRHGVETRDDLAFFHDSPQLTIDPELGSDARNINELNGKDLATVALLMEQIEKAAKEKALEDQLESDIEAALADSGESDAEDIFVEVPDRDSVYSDGGLVFLKNPKRFLFNGASNGPAEEDAEYELGFRPDLRPSEFERRERLDVKKPGPWYRTVNNFAFDKRQLEPLKPEPRLLKMNPEFAGLGPADMRIHDTSSQQDKMKLNTAQQKASGSAESDEVGQLVNLMKKAGSTAEASKLAKQVPGNQLEVIDTSFVSIQLGNKIPSWKVASDLVTLIADFLDLKHSTFQFIRLHDNTVITFQVTPNKQGLTATQVADEIERRKLKLEEEMDVKIVTAKAGVIANLQAEFGVNGEGEEDAADEGGRISPDFPATEPFILDDEVHNKNLYLGVFAVCGIVAAALVASFLYFLVRRTSKSREKLAKLSQDDPAMESCKDYQDLCRARMASKSNEKVEPIRAVQRVQSNVSEGGTSSSRSSTSSWSEEPVLTNMDISTGHMVLSYMEDHLKKKDRLDQEWAALCTYEADPGSTSIGEKAENQKKNRYTNSLPYDHSRVILNDLANVSGADYINASTITDHDPRNPAYIATQGPLPNTAADFWQMVWEQGSVVIVTLTKLTENGTPLCHRYWPEEGSELHHIYEVHLVSEHIWCDEYLVRSFYLKNLKTGETRTVTQFHFLAWPENGIPTSAKSLLEFRRKVNKSYRGRSCPIIVHCSDGAGRSGTYALIDMVLNRMTKGAKEIDIAASLEHIRDQRPGMVRTKQQFEFVLMAVAEEVHAILKALPQ